MPRSSQDLRRIADVLGEENRANGLGEKTCIVVDVPDHSSGDVEILPGQQVCGTGFDIIVVGSPSMYHEFFNAAAFKSWVDTSLRTRLEPGGMFVEVHG